MSNSKLIADRRSFLKVSAAAGGGLILGFNLVSCKEESKLELIAPQALDQPSVWSEVNGFVKIGNNNVVTIMSPNPEIGQNVKTSMPMIIAEELDADWDKVIVEQAPLNTEIFTRQLAGGSQSIRQGWTALRTTGATARDMLLTAAAAQLSVPKGELTTDKGTIQHKASGKSLTYGEVADAAAAVEVPSDVSLKEAKDFKIIGQDIRNVDGFNIAMGKSLFGLDVQKEGALIAMIIHPPAFGMELGSVDAAAAKAMPGIKDVITINTQPEGAELQWSDTNAFPNLVAVVGESTWQVMQAKKKVEVQWKRTADVTSTQDQQGALEAGMASGEGKSDRLDGNPSKALASAAKVLERTYTAPFLAHNTMEPMNFYADVKDGSMYVEGPIQTPEYLRKSLSSICSMPEDKIDIMMTRMGGGFGRRLYGNFGVEAAVISQQIGAPVKLVYSREDDMTQGTYRPDYRVTYKGGLDENGNLIALTVDGIGTHGSPVFAHRFPAGAVDHYEAKNFSQESAISTGAWRAPRSNFIATAEQSFLDELAELAGKDPIDFRLELFDRAKSNPVGEKYDYDADRYAGVLKLVKEKCDWANPPAGISRGVSAYYCHNSYVAQVLDVAMEDGLPKVKKVHCAVDCGIVVHPEGARNQIEGGIVDGIGHALYSKMTFADNGVPQQNNFHQYRLIRNSEAPESIEIHFVDNGIAPTGLGEPSLPPIGAALANAIYQASGKRLYNQPYMDEEVLMG